MDVNAELLAVAKAYEQWEADLIMSDEAWNGNSAMLPTITQELWDRLIEIQTMRNRAVAAALPSPAADAPDWPTLLAPDLSESGT